MTQTVDNIRTGYALFGDADYQAMLARKTADCEDAASAEEVKKVFDWTTTAEYKELNFAREALTIDPAKACQPLGSVLCALGFEDTLPYVHGSQGCVAYFRTYFNRHFKEPVACVSDSMTEDAAVFGGQQNMFDGLQNAVALYKPKMVAVSTTCMAEVIGDDLNAFITNAKKQGFLDESMPAPYAHTPSFVGSHLNGWDAMLEGVLRTLTFNQMDGKQVGSNGKINLVPGFETYLGNYKVLGRMLAEMGVETTMLSDPSSVLDTPADGEYRMYAGGTKLADVADAPNAITTILVQPWQIVRSEKFIRDTWNHEIPALAMPMGLAGTDAFLMKVSELTGKAIPASLAAERGRLVDMMADSHTWLHGKSFSLYGDPDFVMGLTSFLLEIGAEPKHVFCHNGSKKWKKAMEKILAASPFGQQAEVYVGYDLWHLRSLLFTNKPDFLIGNSYGKFLQRDTLAKGKEFEVPLIRLGFPLFDRHHLHHQTTLGYEGAMSIVTTLTNAVLEKLDADTMTMGVTDYAFDLVR